MQALDLRERVAKAFVAELAGLPAMSLRAAAATDVGLPLPPFDAVADSPSNAYLAAYAYDLPFLDAASWRHYLPRYLTVAVDRTDDADDAVSGLLTSLRPPDLDPPRFASLSCDQEATVRAVLEHLAFADGSAHSEAACTALQEWWGEQPMYRQQNAA